MKSQPPIYIISLPESAERRRIMSEQLEKFNLECEFIEAVDGRAMDVPSHPSYDVQKRRRYFGRDLKGGELGCLLSHKSIYQKMVDDNIEAALILEDDCILYDDFPAVLDALMTDTTRFECVRFIGSPKVMTRGGRKVLNLTGDYWLTRMPTAPGGAYATLMTRSGAQKIIPHLSPSAYPVDAVLGRCWETGLDAYTVIPAVANYEEELGSYIGDQRFSKKIELSGLDKVFFPINRAAFRIAESIGKRAFFYSKYFSDKSSLRTRSG